MIFLAAESNISAMIILARLRFKSSKYYKKISKTFDEKYERNEEMRNKMRKTEMYGEKVIGKTWRLLK